MRVVNSLLLPVPRRWNLFTFAEEETKSPCLVLSSSRSCLLKWKCFFISEMSLLMALGALICVCGHFHMCVVKISFICCVISHSLFCGHETIFATWRVLKINSLEIHDSLNKLTPNILTMPKAKRKNNLAMLSNNWEWIKRWVVDWHRNTYCGGESGEVINLGCHQAAPLARFHQQYHVFGGYGPI